MKFLQTLCVLGVLSAASVSSVLAAPPPAEIHISGTNDAAVNGTYTYNGDFNSKASWAKGDYVLRWSVGIMGLSWNIEKPLPIPGELYYSSWDPAGIPPEVYWSCQADAASPCVTPTVTVDPLPDSLFVSGTVDTFLDGEYAREQNNPSHNGFPRYVMGDYEIHVEPVWTNPWTIEHTGTGFKYYGNNNYGSPFVPEGGWTADANATGPPYVPPVVTAGPLPDTLYVSGTVDDFLNGGYIRGLNGNGCPLYAKGDYIISRVEWTAMVMGEPWSLKDTSSGNVYYTSYDGPDGIKVPEVGWLAGFSAAGPPYTPPVMSATQLPDKYKVYGAGSTEVNGLYTRTLNSPNGLVYEKQNGVTYRLEAGHFTTMELQYGITGSSGAFYTVSDDTLNIPASGWAVGPYGTASPPYVIPYAFPWQMFLPSFTGSNQ